MRIVCISHSTCAERQQLFFKELSKHAEVLVLSPSKWGRFNVMDEDSGNYHLRSFLVRNEGDVFGWFFEPQAYQAIEEFKPNIIYYQGDVRLLREYDGSLRLNQAVISQQWAKTIGAKYVHFFWENLRYPTYEEQQFIKRSDFVIAGNTSGKLMYNANIVMPQTGIEISRFSSKEKKRDVVFIGRKSIEKGIEYIKKAYPNTQFYHDLPYSEVPTILSESKIVVSFPFDSDFWAEQWLSYSVAESCASGCLVIASDTASLAEYAENSPVQLVPMHDWEKLKEKIEYFLSHDKEREDLAKQSIEFAQQFSNENIAKKLLKLFEVIL